MTPASAPRNAQDVRLLHVDPASEMIAIHAFDHLVGVLRRGDVLVVNDAATLPASLTGACDGRAVEARLAGRVDDATFTAVLFGEGDWRTPTENRVPPPLLAPGSTVQFPGVAAEVVATDATSPRLVTLRFAVAGAPLWRALYGAGRPVQYAHLTRPLHLWDVQTPYAARPWAVEPPSAGLPLQWRHLLQLRRAGVTLAQITHAAGLSACGEEALDARLPLPEAYEVPAVTAHAVATAYQRDGRVVAVGTSVVRALESAARGGELAAVTDLRLDAGTQLRVVDGILTGMHEPGTSHFELLRAFAPEPLLQKAERVATAHGLLSHEFGDSMLLLGCKGREASRHARLRRHRSRLPRR
ncbi:MAG: S-adenosylmethionine:tRNA ribosyltransferase-isomerase [Planctomycetota bacterium]